MHHQLEIAKLETKGITRQSDAAKLQVNELQEVRVKLDQQAKDQQERPVWTLCGIYCFIRKAL